MVRSATGDVRRICRGWKAPAGAIPDNHIELLFGRRRVALGISGCGESDLARSDFPHFSYCAQPQQGKLRKAIATPVMRQRWIAAGLASAFLMAACSGQRDETE